MRFHLLGSAAGKPVPRTFCRCRVCLHAMEQGGPDLRTRTGMNLFVDGDNSPEPKYRIDLPPDTGHHMMVHRFNMNLLEHLLLTHYHEDHFDLLYLTHRGRAMSDRAEMPWLNIYGSAETGGRFDSRNLNLDDLRLRYHQVEPFQTFSVGELEVFSLKGNHAPGTLHYVIRHAGKSVLLAWDTGFYEDETWEALQDLKLDAVFMECTQFGGSDAIRYNSHCNFHTLRMMRERLLDMNVIHCDTPYITVHMGDNGLLLHSERVELAEPHNITVGYDGLELEV
ncbi:MAG: MBL fold metallo-hydrolase [Planctomycetota bacterium]|nr:MBL fold metallo-hydrolase [Planctomycetota bacterium]